MPEVTGFEQLQAVPIRFVVRENERIECPPVGGLQLASAPTGTSSQSVRRVNKKLRGSPTDVNSD